MEDFVYSALLLDFYGGFLTKKQRDIFQKRFCYNFTLENIGHGYTMSRQAVWQSLARSHEKLEAMEADLKMIAHHKTAREYVDKLKAALEKGDIDESKEILTALDKLIMENGKWKPQGSK